MEQGTSEPLQMRRLSELEETALKEAARVFVEGFYQHLKMFSSDKEALIRAFEHALVPEQFFVAMEGGRIVGITAFSTNRKRSIRIRKPLLQTAFGRFRGWLIFSFLSQELERPLSISDHQCYIESVATAPEARGKGIAYALQTYILETLPYTEFILEVVDTNATAIRLYERLGYRVFDKRKQRLFRRQAGFNERWYMKLSRV